MSWFNSRKNIKVSCEKCGYINKEQKFICEKCGHRIYEQDNFRYTHEEYAPTRKEIEKMLSEAKRVYRIALVEAAKIREETHVDDLRAEAINLENRISELKEFLKDIEKKVFWKPISVIDGVVKSFDDSKLSLKDADVYIQDIKEKANILREDAYVYFQQEQNRIFEAEKFILRRANRKADVIVRAAEQEAGEIIAEAEQAAEAIKYFGISEEKIKEKIHAGIEAVSEPIDIYSLIAMQFEVLYLIIQLGKFNHIAAQGYYVDMLVRFPERFAKRVSFEISEILYSNISNSGKTNKLKNYANEIQSLFGTIDAYRETIKNVLDDLNITIFNIEQNNN